MTDSVRIHFSEARDRVITFGERERHGIGMQKEKTMHSVVKYFEDPDPDHHEIPIGPHVADIYSDGCITEIQTANFNSLRDRLRDYLPEYKVKIVYPIPHIKYVTWIDPETGQLEKTNRSPKKGSFYDCFRELYKIRSFLSDRNLSIELLLIDTDEYRLRDGWGKGGKRGSHRYDRVPKALAESITLSCPADYLAFVPADLQEPFTSSEAAKAAGRSPSGFSTVLLILTEQGILDRVGKRGRSYLYRINSNYSD